MSFILPGALRRREPLRGGGDVPTCTVSEGCRDGVAFLNPEGKKTLLLTYTGVYSRSVPMHWLLLPQLLGYLSFQSYATSTLPMGSLRAWGGECLRVLFPSSVAHDISHFHAVRRGVEAVQASWPCLDCRAPQFCSFFRFLCISIS